MANNILFLTIGLVTVLAATPTNGGSVGAKVLFQGDTELYLCRINRGSGLNPIEVAKESPDVDCEFELFYNDDETYSFKADNGMFISLVDRNGNNPIEAANKKKIDQYSKFNVMDEGLKITILADNENFLSRINRGEGHNPVEAAMKCIYDGSVFKGSRVKATTAGVKNFTVPKWLDKRILQ